MRRFILEIAIDEKDDEFWADLKKPSEVTALKVVSMVESLVEQEFKQDLVSVKLARVEYPNLKFLTRLKNFFLFK
jgi:hypothetical protein